MVAWRVLTLGSGKRTSLPPPRPITMRDPSNVSDGASGLGPLAVRTATVTGIRPSRRRDALERRTVVVRLALDPLDHVLRDVAVLVLAELLDARRRRDVH